MATTELKNCPFCGNEAQYRDGHEHSYIGGYTISIFVECSSCNAEMSSFYGTDMGKETTEHQAKEKLAKMWNQRV